MHGIRIIDLTRVLAGPLATQQLADQGAEVIKIEPPAGDETRFFGPFHQDQSTYFLCANRNKRAMTLDLKQPEGRAILERLLVTGDVLIHNFRPGVAERLGVDFDTVHQAHPQLVYVAIHAFGEDAGEWTRRGGYDLVLQALGGAPSITGRPTDPPTKCGASIADIVTAHLATQAVLFGLLHRERTGAADRIVVNMMQAQAQALAYHWTRLSVTGEVEHRRGNTHRGLVPYAFYPSKDDWIAIAVANDRQWQRLRELIGAEDDPRLHTNEGRIDHREEVDGLVTAWTQVRTVEELDQQLAGAGIPCGAVNPVDKAIAHPAVTGITVEHPILGPVTLPGPALTTATTRRRHTPPPLFNEHAAEILAELTDD